MRVQLAFAAVARADVVRHARRGVQVSPRLSFERCRGFDAKAPVRARRLDIARPPTCKD